MLQGNHSGRQEEELTVGISHSAEAFAKVMSGKKFHTKAQSAQKKDMIGAQRNAGLVFSSCPLWLCVSRIRFF
jgi:hypothetical protein